MGKVMGLIARESVLQVTGEMMSDQTERLCLAHIVTGDDEVVEKIKDAPCITLDGCAKCCAQKSVEAAGGHIKNKYRVIDFMKKHRGEEHGTGRYLTEEGFQFVDELAKMMANDIVAIQEEV
ncbi:MAG: putative zinc-binding protein [Eubacterium sp.]